MSVVLKLVILGVICLLTASLIGGGLYWHQIRANHLKSLQSHQMKTTASLNTTTMFLNATTPLNAPLNTTTETNDHHSVDLPNMQTGSESESGSKRSKRAIIFRPLFVYRQQEIKKQRLQEERDKKLIEYYAYHATSTTTTTTTQRPKYASYYPYMSSTRH